MLDVVISLVVSFAITYFSIPPILTIAKLKNLYDLPDERKIHSTLITSLGGVGIFAGFAISLLLTAGFEKTSEFQYILAAAIILFFVGIKDDILIISPMKKFAGQVTASLLMILKGGIQLKNLNGFLGIGELPWIVSVVLTLILLVVVINSFNLIDGVDGLAGALGLVASFLPGMYFLFTGDTPYALLAFCITGSVTAFMSYNFQPARIFMGDTGSLLIGLVCSVILIHFLNAGVIYSTNLLYSAPALGFSLVMIPVLDAARVSALRLMRGTSPFVADRNHIHHIMLDKGFSHKSVTFTLVAATLIFAGLTYLGKGLGNTALIAALTVCYFLSIKLLSLIPASSDRPISNMENDNGRVQLKPVQKITLQKKVMAD